MDGYGAIGRVRKNEEKSEYRLKDEMEEIIILGNGGHATSVIDVIERQGNYKIVGCIVNEDYISVGKCGYPVIGKDTDLVKIFESGIHNVAVGIGFLGKSDLRKKLYYQLKKIGYVFPVICDPSAIMSDKIIVEEGSFIGKGAILNADVRIGKMCIINTRAVIEHNCQIDDFSHISVGTILCGGVKVGENTFIGANATVIQEQIVGNNCIVGAGEVIKENILENTKYVTTY